MKLHHALGHNPAALIEFDVDNLEVEAILIRDYFGQEMCALFDFTAVRVFLVNCDDPSTGTHTLLRGWFANPLVFNAACLRLPPIALPIATVSLGGCATAVLSTAPAFARRWWSPERSFGSERLGEVGPLPASSDFRQNAERNAVMRQQARACGGP